MSGDGVERLILLRKRIKSRICAIDAERESLAQDLAKAEAAIDLMERHKRLADAIVFVPQKRSKRGGMGRFIQDIFREADSPVTVPLVVGAWIETLGSDPLPHERQNIRYLVKYHFKELRKKGRIQPVDTGQMAKGWRVTRVN